MALAQDLEARRIKGPPKGPEWALQAAYDTGKLDAYDSQSRVLARLEKDTLKVIAAMDKASEKER